MHARIWVLMGWYALIASAATAALVCNALTVYGVLHLHPPSSHLVAASLLLDLLFPVLVMCMNADLNRRNPKERPH